MSDQDELKDENEDCGSCGKCCGACGEFENIDEPEIADSGESNTAK